MRFRRGNTWKAPSAPPIRMMNSQYALWPAAREMQECECLEKETVGEEQPGHT